MPRTVEVTVRVADLLDVKQAIAQAVAAARADQRLRFLALVKATCACRSCKDAVIAELLKEG